MNDHYLAMMLLSREAMLRQFADDYREAQTARQRHRSRKAQRRQREGIVVQLRRRAETTVSREAA